MTRNVALRRPQRQLGRHEVRVAAGGLAVAAGLATWAAAAGGEYTRENLVPWTVALAAATAVNADRCFDAFARQYDLNVLRTSEVVDAVRSLTERGVRLDDVWFAGWEYRVDPRNVGFELGAPGGADTNAFDPGEPLPPRGPRRLAVVVYPADTSRLREASVTYGSFRRIAVPSVQPGRGFLVLVVPARR